ncbi:hypothetical protein [Halpernia sp. GG3]
MIIKKLLFLIIPIFTFSQNSNLENKLITDMCSEFSNTESLSDSARVENTYSKYLYPYLKKIVTSKVDSVGTSIYFRFQRECESFRKFLDRVDPLKNYKELSEIPKSTLTESERKEFQKIKNFYYFEGNDNKTKVLLEKGFWTDNFPDDTYSKNIFRWKNNSKFELEFIESTNINRKGFSREGDKYFYNIISKENNYYLIAAQIPKQNQILLFKLFIN